MRDLKLGVAKPNLVSGGVVFIGLKAVQNTSEIAPGNLMRIDYEIKLAK